MGDSSKIREYYHTKRYSYSTESYPFKRELEKIFGIPLCDIHKWLGEFDVFNKDNDQNTLAHKVFYSNFNSNLKNLYDEFIRKQLANFLSEDFYYQKIPTFRIGLPGNKFVGEFHKDSDYNHQDYELNFNLGLCNYLGKRSLKVQEKPNSKNFIYLECPYGEVFSFDHINCIHGSELNMSDQTMVSFDFRIALKNYYFDSEKKSITNNSIFNKGFYFNKELVKGRNRQNNSK